MLRYVAFCILGWRSAARQAVLFFYVVHGTTASAQGLALLLCSYVFVSFALNVSECSATLRLHGCRYCLTLLDLATNTRQRLQPNRSSLPKPSGARIALAAACEIPEPLASILSQAQASSSKTRRPRSPFNPTALKLTPQNLSGPDKEIRRVLEAGECIFAEIIKGGAGGAAFKNPEDALGAAGAGGRG